MNIKEKNSAPKRVAIYIRVSTSMQADKDSLPMQRKDLISYSELILGIPDYEIFEDAGYTGKNTDRPAYQDMLERIRGHEFSHLLVWKIDRISRNLIDFSEMYTELKRLRVVFVSKYEQFDTSTAMGEAMLKIILVFAELERNMTAERVTATMISRASQGLWNGGRIPYGYDYDFDTSEFSIIDEEAAVCRFLAEDYLRYKSLSHAAMNANNKGFLTRSGIEWSASTVWIILQSPFYAGIYRYNHYHGTKERTVNDRKEWVMVENHHPAIFTKEEHERMLAIMEENRTTQNTENQHNFRKYVHVFSQICYCGKCGSRMFAMPSRVHSDGYRTSLYICRIKKRTRACDNPSVIDIVIGDFVVNYIVNIIKAKKNIRNIDINSLQSVLLEGKAFKDVLSINETGLNELYKLLRKYKGGSDLFEKPKSSRNPNITALLKEKEKQQRALKRLQDVFLYADKAMPEKDYIIQRQEIIDKLNEIDSKLKDNPELSDDDFISKASHLLINKRLQNSEYIDYKELASSTSPDVLQQYIRSIVDHIQITDKQVTGITFKNGITHRFTYKKAGG